MRTSNPALNAKTFSNLQNTSENTMTLQGTINKCFFLIALVFLSATYTWTQAFPSGQPDAIPSIPNWYIPVIIVAFVVALIIIFKKETAPYLTPVYALLEGAVLGALSVTFEMRYPGIVSQAILGTAGVFTALLMAYKSGLIKATENFKLGVVAATGGIALIYLISFIMSFFGSSIPMIHEGGLIGIGFSVVVVAVAALNLVLDFDFIENASEQKLPKFMEWYAAFGLLITLVWLYVEILRLLGKTRK